MFSKHVLLIAIVTTLVYAKVVKILPNSEQRLIKTSEGDAGTWLNQQEILDLKQSGVGFIDVTNHYKVESASRANLNNEIPNLPLYHEQVSQVIEQIDMDLAEFFLKNLSGFFNRHYHVQSGYDAAVYIVQEIMATVAETNFSGCNVSFFEHPWLQPSVIARIEGSDDILKEELIILGSHLDSFTYGPDSPAPGADDDGSGTTVVLEALRSILRSGYKPKRTLEFHWYAAEEVGLLGSDEIARNYSTNHVNVFSMLNFDVEGYYSNDNRIGVNTDYTDPDLTSFLRTLIQTYTSWGVKNRTCGYGCSDHVSFTDVGYRTGYVKEPINSPYWHTPSDTIETISFTQLNEFVKLAIAYAVELSIPRD